jgi:hypothetical protein
MSSTISPNMSLIIPTVGQEPGPEWASDLNASLTLIDLHDHTPGSGVPITPSGLDINSSLTLNSNFLTNAAGITFSAQGSTPAIGTIYEAGVDLYFVDGLGNNIRITQSGGIAGSPGSIANLTPPASVTYVSGSKTFVFQSDVSIAANLDAASILIRNITPNSTNAITVQAPAALSSNYDLVLPLLPSSQKIMTLDNSGNMAAPYSIDTNTLVITSNVIGVKDSGINTQQIADGAVTAPKLDPDLSLMTAVLLADGVPYIVPDGVTVLPVLGAGGAGGGGGGCAGGGTGSSAGGGGGSAAEPKILFLQVTPGQSITPDLGIGGNGGAAGVGGGAAGSDGQDGQISEFGGLSFPGGAGGKGGTTATGAGGDGGMTVQALRSGTPVPGGHGGASAAASQNGYFSPYATGGTSGVNASASGGGGGGGACLANGGNGGAGINGSPAAAGSPGSLGSGGGGGGGSNASTAGAGGNGGTGFLIVYAPKAT